MELCRTFSKFSRILPINNCQILAVGAISKRSYAVDATTLSNLKRGTGGRSSFSGVVATVFGANGYLGKHVVTRLGRSGAQIIIPYRGDPYYLKDLKLCGDLGQILFIPFNLRDDVSIEKSMRHSNVVINCIGQSIPSKLDFFIEDTNVEGAERIARISRDLNVKRFIHVSALSQSSTITHFKNRPELSKFMTTKAEGEKLVREHRPDATIFRPANMWGQYDRFLQYLASKKRRLGFGRKAYVYMHGGGVESVKQPVYYGDVAEGIIRTILSADAEGEIYEAVGPHRYRMDDLIKWIYFIMRYLPEEINVVKSLFWRRLTEKRIFQEMLLHDYLTDQLSGTKTLTDLGVPLTKIEDRIHHALYWHRRYREYWDAVGEFPAPPNPPIQNP